MLNASASSAYAQSGAWVDAQISQMRGGGQNPGASLASGLNGGGVPGLSPLGGGFPGLGGGLPGLGGGLPGLGGGLGGFGGGCGCQNQGLPSFGQNFGGPQTPFQQGFQQGQKAAKVQRLMGKLRRLMAEMGGAAGMNPNANGMQVPGAGGPGAFASAGPGGAFASAGPRLI